MKKILAPLFVLCCMAASAQKKVSPALDHIAVYVVDLQKSTHFYQNIMGLDTIPEPFHDGRHTWFKLGTGALHLIQGPDAAAAHNKNNHLCFRVKDLNAFTQRLAKAGINHENWLGEKSVRTRRPDGVEQIYLQDPDGRWLEVNNAR